MIINKKNKRVLVVIGSLVCQFCVGMLYSWSIFQNPIIEYFHSDIGTIAKTFSIATFMLPVTMILGGFLLKRIGARKTVLLGGGLLTFGLLLASTAISIEVLYIGYGFFGGAGVGLVYGIPIAVCKKWYPDKKGAVMGLAIAGFGLGSTIYGPVASHLLHIFSVFTVFKIQAVVTMIGIFLGSTMIQEADDGYCPAGYILVEIDVTYGCTPGEMIKSKNFLMMMIMYICANTIGLMMVGNAVPLGVFVANTTAAQGGVIISALSIANTLGRINGGWASDRFGVEKVIVYVHVANLLALWMLLYVSGFLAYIILVILIAYNFGVVVGAYPSIVLKYYGNKHYSVNYGIVFLAYGIAGIIGARLMSYSLERWNNYDFAIAFSVAYCILSIFIMTYMMKFKKHDIKGGLDCEKNKMAWQRWKWSVHSR